MKSHMRTVRECGVCGRRIRGPSFFRHSDSCRRKHGQRSGKPWRAKARSVSRRYASLLKAMARSPKEHESDAD